MRAKRERPEQKLDPATKSFLAGVKLVAGHPLFVPLLGRVHLVREKNNLCPRDGWAVVLESGAIHVHPTRRGDADEWAYVLAHTSFISPSATFKSARSRSTGTPPVTSWRRDSSRI